ncbi:SUKH-4 family immunity protein [Streptomyces sp. NPDC047981]|uniref:SUKH-4 family immunity protein n=1 Tax=Streptomyces sp. NPDC047981 TaxID=3154610 RepID=UPI0034179B62
MEFEQARSEVARILAADLRGLVTDGPPSVLPPSAARTWNLPGEDTSALFSYGLPDPARAEECTAVRGMFQHSEQPEYRSPEARGYVIGVCGSARIVAQETSGVVLAVPEARELIPQLAHLAPEGIQDETINSSAGRLVDFAWRWMWLAPVLAEQEMAADAAEMVAWKQSRAAGSREPVPDVAAPYRNLCRTVRERLRELDPMALRTDDSMWAGLVGGFE